MSDCDLSPIVQQMEYSQPAGVFSTKSVEDTRGTIRFIDTKAAFCVTLLSGMVAGVLQKGHGGHGPLFALFIAGGGAVAGDLPAGGDLSGYQAASSSGE